MLRRLGNILTVLGSIAGLLAGYLWWRAATTHNQVAFANMSRDAALVTGVSAMLIAVAESIRMVRRRRADWARMIPRFAKLIPRSPLSNLVARRCRHLAATAT
jgi:hypothetical protein